MTPHMQTRPTRGHMKGFTLIEVMIVAIVIAVLAVIAIPSYQEHIVKTFRSKANACMAEHAQFMERYYTTNLTYVGAVPNLGCVSEGTLDTRYTLDVGGIAQGTYTVTATPIGIQNERDTRCGTLTLDQTGSRSVSGTASVDACL